MGQKGFNQFSEVSPELVVDKDGKMYITGNSDDGVFEILQGLKNAPFFPELKFKNGDFER